MKQSIILAGLVAGFASANAHFPKHAHANAHVRRQDAYTTWTTVTHMDYVTLAPGQGAPVEEKAAVAGNQGAPSGGSSVVSQVQAAPMSSSSTTAAPLVQAPVNPQVQAAAVNSQPPNLATTTSASATGNVAAPAITDPALCPDTSPDAYQNCVNSAQGYINSMQKAADYSHQDSMNSYQGTAGAQTSVSVNPTVSAPNEPGAPAPSAGFAYPDASGCATTIMTYYGGQGGTGSCGYKIDDANNTVAIAQHFQPKCNQMMDIWVDGATDPVEAIVADTCPACATDGHVDASEDWAMKIAPQIVTAGHVTIKYCWK